ncbi:hypothetical protein CRI94_11025 [Longibacter salinarum]|uniref:ABC transporter permease n=1 Tax=Longibacter salinarum TaxID=1850348 RepID=A0A2A8CX29_9BACT|nr:ABC transporter permease [Longibacter salinarum]PEN13171.1 hypothetical protein CRI94_11025 [Longibacter salinarum]
MLEKLTYNVTNAFEAIAQNKLRAALTSLGIIFGVGSVIAMLAIGHGAEQEILRQIRILGATNVIVTPIVEQEQGTVSEDDAEEDGSRPYSPGLTLADARSIEDIVPGVESISPETVFETTAIQAGIRRTTKIVGVTPAYFHSSVDVAEGTAITDDHLRTAKPVAVIGQKVKARFFPKEEAIGGRIKVGDIWLTVIGVMQPRGLSKESRQSLGLRDYDYDIYTPLSTLLTRYVDRSRLSRRDLEAAARDANSTRFAQRRGYRGAEMEVGHQIDRLVVRTAGSGYVRPVAEVVDRMLKRRHNDVVDYQVVVPEQLLAQERRTQTVFNVVLAAIASISLIVGGIGIMNIMLASVMERIREIGVRRAVGATQWDITVQFVVEALSISSIGGVVGICLGIAISVGIEAATDIPTIVTLPAVLLAFVVSAGVGLLFGYLPAKRAAERDPVVALRHE